MRRDVSLGKRIKKGKIGRVPFVIVVGDSNITQKEFEVQHNKTGEVAFKGSIAQVVDYLKSQVAY